jgi:hypothetical protein
MIVVGSDLEATHRVAFTPESALSQVRAIAAVGFGCTLGRTSVATGPDFHKRVLKNEAWGSKFDEQFLPRIFAELKLAFQKEIDSLVGESTKEEEEEEEGRRVLVPDLFHFVRRCMIRVTLNGLVGSCLLEPDADHLVEEMMML